jgi:hypothetical protein
VTRSALAPRPASEYCLAAIGSRHGPCGLGFDVFFILLGVWGTHDTGGRIQERSGEKIRVRSGTIVSPATQLRVLTIYRNTRIPPFVHGLVDRVLVPVHRSHPLARVSMRRF